MSNVKPGKFTLVATHENSAQDKAFVKVEGELTEVQWDEVVDGLKKLITLYTNFKQELMSEQALD